MVFVAVSIEEVDFNLVQSLPHRLCFMLLHTHLAALLINYGISYGQRVVVYGREHVMNTVDVEPSVDDVRPESAAATGHVGARGHLVLSEVPDLLVPLGPLPSSAVASPSQVEKRQVHYSMNHTDQLDSEPPVIGQPVHGGYLECPDKVQQFWFFLFGQRYYHNFEQSVDWRCYQVNQFFGNVGERTVGWRALEEVCDRLKALDLEVEEGVGVCMVTQAMHFLPLLMSPACHHPQVAEGVVSHVNKVVSNPKHRIAQQACDCCQDKRAEESAAYKEHKPKQGDYCPIFDRLVPVLQLLCRVLLEESVLDPPKQTSLLKSVSRFLFFLTLANIVFVHDLPRFFLIQMMCYEVFSNVLAFGVDQPLRSSGVLLDEVSQVVQLVFHNPQRVLISPQLLISLGLLTDPYFS